MRTLLIIAFGLCMATCSLAETNTGETPDCFIRLAEDKRIGDSITVFYDDSTVVRGRSPIINFKSSILYMRNVTDSSITHSVTIPFDRISRITYLKPASSRAGLIRIRVRCGRRRICGRSLSSGRGGFHGFFTSSRGAGRWYVRRHDWSREWLSDWQGPGCEGDVGMLAVNSLPPALIYP